MALFSIKAVVYNKNMPELPEVEVVVRGLADNIVGKKFTKVEIRQSKLANFSPEQFRSRVQNQEIQDVQRIGKMIVVHLEQDVMVIHLKMTGQLVYENTFLGGHTFTEHQKSYVNAHTHLIFQLDDGTCVYYNDQRLFGYCHLVPKEELTKYSKTYGMEPVNGPFKWEDFWKLVSAHPRMNFKAFLLTQKYVAGIGNIYADETAFRSAIDPHRKLGEISEKKWQEVHRHIRDILLESIKWNGTTFSHFLSNNAEKGNFKQFLKVYGRGGKPCDTCGKTLLKIKLAGRGTVYCSHCQK